MSISNIIEVGLGLAVAYYVLGLIVSFISARILETLGTRSKILKEYLYSLLEDGQILDKDTKTRKRLVAESKKVKDFLDLQQIKALAPIGYKRAWGIFGVKTEKKSIDTIPSNILLEALLDQVGLTDLDNLTIDDIKTSVAKLPESSEVRQTLQALVDKGVTSKDDLQRRAGRWADGIMAQASAQYKANARAWVILLAVLVTALTGLDTIEYGVDLWNNPQRREVAAARANAALQADQQETDIDALLDEVEALNMKIGWFTLPDSLPVVGEPAGQVVRYWVLKVIGLIITVVAVAQGSSFWFDTMRKLTANPESNPKVS